MPNFGELKPDTYYLIQVDAESDIELVSVILQTKEAVLLRSFLPESEDFFQFNDAPIFRLIEEFDQDTAGKFENLYEQREQQEFFEFEEEGEEE
jgi:hypothetical protein